MNLEINELPELLKKYGNTNFENLFNLKPEELGQVLVYDRQNKVHNEKTIYRFYKSYLASPKFDPKVDKSYMFSNAADTLREKDCPPELIPYLSFAKSLDSRYNQMTVNWYEPENLIEMHRDCTAKMVEPTILCINLNENDSRQAVRDFEIQDVKTGEECSIPLINNRYLIMSGDSQITHRHGVGTGKNKRISITFRMINPEL